MPGLTDEALAEIRHVAGYFRTAYSRTAIQEAVREVLAEGKPPEGKGEEEEEGKPKAPPPKVKEETPPKEEETPAKRGLYWASS